MPWPLEQTRVPELMDDPALDEREHLQALAALARINALSRTAAWLAAGVRTMLPAPPGTGTPDSFTVIDVASGGGDVTIDVARRLRRAGQGGQSIRVIGIDFSHRAVARSRAVAASRGIDAAFETSDVLANGCPPCDVAVSSLFLHHLDDDTACGLLASMAAAARHGIVVSDLVRSRVGLGLALVGTVVLCSSRIARIDGPNSVRAARTPAEYRQLCAAAGLPGATIRRVWPERVILQWRRSPPRA
jgi:2-polyprenyl-3-methyl-5-hydroxy-6-metoxy-1,4-benzoquinol methylase